MNTLTHHIPFISLQATHCMVIAWWEYCISVRHFTYFPDSLLSVLLIIVACHQRGSGVGMTLLALQGLDL